MKLAPTEELLWEKPSNEAVIITTDQGINDRYARGEGRIVIETNREKLPGFVALLKQKNYMDLRPFYQRRPRWSHDKQSLLIESFIMNIPVPPVFLYEKEYNAYEVMDGQQRITALRAFYEGEFELEGLQQWPELNGRRYATLPEKLKAGLDRRSISSIVLLKESTTDEEEASNLRETVFERLNTGGVELTRQEIRNALYRGRMNSLLERLSRLPSFRKAWKIPEYVENEIFITKDLLKNTMFAKMEDEEMVLRFFALRHTEQYKHGMQGFLDLYMRRSISFTESDITVLETLFVETLILAISVYGDLVFHPFNKDKNEWDPNAQKAFYDAVMVGLADLIGRAEAIKLKANVIVAATREMFINNEDGTFTGRGNTKDDIKTRIQLFKTMVEGAIA